MYSPSSPSGWQTGSASVRATPAGSLSAHMRKKGSSDEMSAENDQARLRGSLESAYNAMYGVDDSLPPESNTLRKRIALLVRETNLRKENVVDRGLSLTNSRARFTLRSDFVAGIQDIVQQVQQVVDLLQAEFREIDEEWWQFDPNGALIKGLTEARSITALHLAWGMFHRRASTSVDVHRKYRERVLAKLEQRQTTLLSPLSTPRSVYGEMRNFDDNELRLKYMLGSVPVMKPIHRHPTDKDAPPAVPAKEDRARYLKSHLPDVVQVPSPLLRAFPDREVESSPKLVYYEGDQRREGAPSTTYGNPDPLPSQEQAEYAKKYKTNLGHRIPRPDANDPSVPGPTRSVSRGRSARFEERASPENWRERPLPAQTVSAHGVFSPGSGPPPGQPYWGMGLQRSASSASNPGASQAHGSYYGQQALLNAATSISSRVPTPHASRKDKGLPQTPNWTTAPPPPNRGSGGGGGPPAPPFQPGTGLPSQQPPPPAAPPPGWPPGGPPSGSGVAGAPPPPPPPLQAGMHLWKYPLCKVSYKL